MRQATKGRLTGILLVLLLIGAIWLMLFSGPITPGFVIEPVKLVKGAEPYQPETPRRALHRPPEERDRAAPEAIRSEHTPPKLGEDGLPVGWVVQAGSFQAESNAQRLLAQLLADDLPAFIETDGGDAQDSRYVVVLGPKIKKSNAHELKRLVDARLGGKAMVRRYRPSFKR